MTTAYGRKLAHYRIYRRRLRLRESVLSTSRDPIARKIAIRGGHTRRRSTVLVAVASTDIPHAISRALERGGCPLLYQIILGARRHSSQLPGFLHPRGLSSRVEARCSLLHCTKEENQNPPTTSSTRAVLLRDSRGAKRKKRNARSRSGGIGSADRRLRRRRFNARLTVGRSHSLLIPAFIGLSSFSLSLSNYGDYRRSLVRLVGLSNEV